MTRKSSAPARKSKAEIDADVEIHRIHAKSEVFARIASEVTKWGALVAIFYIATPAIKAAAIAFAGHETVANFSFEWLLSKPAGMVLMALFGGGAVVYGRKQSKLRKDTVERLHMYQERYERSRDPERSSSMLTRRGETRMEDA